MTVLFHLFNYFENNEWVGKLDDKGRYQGIGILVDKKEQIIIIGNFERGDQVGPAMIC